MYQEKEGEEGKRDDMAMLSSLFFPFSLFLFFGLFFSTFAVYTFLSNPAEC